MCGTHKAADAAAADQKAFTSTLLSQASTVFGADSGVFNAMKDAYSNILAAGPSQQGWSAAEANAINSQIINNAAVSNRNIKSAVGNSQAAIGGGGAGVGTSGASANLTASIAEQVEAQKTGQLTQAQIANYQQGNQNWQIAGKGLESAPGVFNNMDSFNKNAQQGLNENMTNAEAADAASNWWVKPVTGLAMAGIGAATGGLGSMALGGSFLSGAGASLLGGGSQLAGNLSRQSSSSAGSSSSTPDFSNFNPGGPQQ